MELQPIAERMELLTDEYRVLVADLGETDGDGPLRDLLVRRAEWTDEGAAAVTRLARQYGSFVLANALALAEAMEFEDGEAGL